MLRFLLPCLLATLPLLAEAQNMNLLRNPQFDFHCFDNSRSAVANCQSAGYVACWNSEAYGDIKVTTMPHVESVKPQVAVRNIVAVKPGKHLYQIVFLPEVGLRHGDPVSLSVFGQQKAPDSLKASVHVLKVDSQTGTWKASDYGMADTREFPKHSRGELVKAKSFSATSGAGNDFVLKLEKCEVVGTPPIHKNESSDSQINSIALMVEFANVSKDADAFIYAPTLVKGATAVVPAGTLLPEMRGVPTLYRGIPRTLRKLWRGELIHILLMGSSIDRGSANPPMYAFDEDPASPKFKQPLAEGNFDGDLVGRPDLTATVGRWQHYYAWGGRLRTELLRKFNYTPEKMLLNYMACDGSCISEATSGIADYASLSLPPDPELNGNPKGKTWQEMYPGLFDRAQGPGPDLVLFGSGANEKTDGAEEGAIFEASIRFLQQRYPDCEFLFCMWQNMRGYTANTGNLMELALNYQIPFVDMGDRIDQLMGYANRYALCPSDGHPQATGHYFWFKSLEEAFEVADPIELGTAQLHLPKRLYPSSYGWEGEIVKYDAPSPRLFENMMVLDDTTVNCWGTVPEKATALIDGEKRRDPRSQPGRNVRNSMFTYGKLSLGDRHVLELTGEGAKITAADCKIAPGRQFIPITSKCWSGGGASSSAVDFPSRWGAPFGEKQIRLRAGGHMVIYAAGTDLALAYVDDAEGGTLKVKVDDGAAVEIPANVPFKDSVGKAYYMENRRGFRNLGYGLHVLTVDCVGGSVGILGLFTYDTHTAGTERRVTGTAWPGETVRFTPPFKVPPLIMTHGGLTLSAAPYDCGKVTFDGFATGFRPGTYEAIGEW